MVRASGVEISEEQAARAIYLDFEGTMTDPASFLGIAIDGVWRVVILEEALWSAATYKVAHGTITAGDLAAALDDLRAVADTERRLVIAWSTRERNEIVSTLGDGEAAQWWDGLLVNALPIAKKWARRHQIAIRQIPSSHGPSSNKHSLTAYMEAVGYHVPRALGTGNSAQRMRHVREQLAKRGDFDNLTRTAKGKWSRCLQHNRHDCLGTAAVVQHIAQSR